MLVNRAHEAGLDVDVVVEGDRRPLPPGIDVSVYRIIQEALTNTMKWAGPVHVDVVLRYVPNQVEVEIVDAGPANGFVAGTFPAGVIRRTFPPETLRLCALLGFPDSPSTA